MMHKISKSSILGPSANEISANWGSQLNPSYSSPASAAAQSLQSRPTLCDPTDGSPPGSPGPGILQARTLEWAAIAFSNAWKWKVKVKLLSHVWPSATPWTAAFQAPPSMHGIFQARVLEWGTIALNDHKSWNWWKTLLVLCPMLCTPFWVPIYLQYGFHYVII